MAIYPTGNPEEKDGTATMSVIRIDEEGLILPGYRIDNNGISLYGPTPDKETTAAYLVFCELAAFQQAGSAGETAMVRWVDLAAFAAMDDNDYVQLYYDLGLPPIYTGPSFLESRGALGTQGFALKLSFPETVSAIGAYGDRNLICQGMILVHRTKGYAFSCSPQLYWLAEAVKRFNEPIPGEMASHDGILLGFARIKKLAVEAGVVTDRLIRSENIIEAGRIQLSLIDTGTKDDPEVALKPKLDIPGLPATAYTDKFDKRLNVDKVMNFNDPEGGRKRVVLNENQHKALDRIKKDYQHMRTHDQLENLIRNPPGEFDEADIDVTELYSQRVKGLGIYHPRTYPFICPYETEWIPGIIIDEIDGQKRILLKTAEEIQRFIHAIEMAERTGTDSIVIDGQTVPLDMARKLLSVIKDHQHEPASDPAEMTRKAEVLLIVENVEELIYKETDAGNDIIERKLDIPGLVDGFSLKPHQYEGIARMEALYRARYPGMILADDMGLGKTIQALGFLEHLSTLDSGVLACIVAPKGLIGNWICEYRERFPNGNLVFKSLMGEKNTILDIKRNQTRYTNVVFLFSYQSLRSNQLDLCAIDWDVAILDEAQQIKTPGTLVTNAAKALKARFKIALTGTPVENAFHDLWCIADFAMPGYLGSARDFAKVYNPQPGEQEDRIREKGELLLSKLGKRFLRRTKANVLGDLPPKYESDNPEHGQQFINTPTVRIMPPLQQEVYDSIIERYRNQKNEGGFQKKKGILDVLLRLKMVCEHPRLTMEKGLQEITGQISDSAKTLTMLEILKAVRDKQERVIIFTEFRRTQRMLAELIHEYFGLMPRIMNGETPVGFDVDTASETRMGIVRSFNESPGFNIIIMSPVAAGIGLTVTGANHVIHFSRHWNPSKEDQATDRAYRIGQEKPVYVYYLIARHPESSIRSFDDNLARLLFLKRSLRGTVLYPAVLQDIKPEDVLSALM
jgi:hypothetical protein